MPERALVELRVLQAWRAFREGHDLEAAKMTCCDASKEFFEAMRAFEEACDRGDI